MLFAHNFEGATASITGPYAMLFASEAIDKIVTYLPKPLDQPENIEYRYWLLYASMLGGIVEDNSECHKVYAVEHAMSGYNPELLHGAGLAILYKEFLPLIYIVGPEGATIALKGLDPTLKPVKEDAEKANT
jgi:alcohol dehydrogenase